MKKSTLSAMVALACTSALSPNVVLAEQSSEKPNIVYIIVDDQRYDALGFMNEYAQTPNMDKIAENGVHFKNAFVTTSLSSPSRASVLTGMYAHNHGIVDNNPNPVVNRLKYFPQELKKAGYQTGFFGKWHFGGIEKDAKAGFAGFDRWVGLLGQGDYYPVDMTGGTAKLNIDGQLVDQKGYITDELTDYALDFLDHRDKDKPFMVYLSHKGVHADFLPAPRHFDTMKDVKFPIPDTYANTDETYKGKPRWVRDQRNSWHGVDFPYMKDLDLQKFQQDYYETLRSVDDSVGEVQAYLEEHDLADNTIIMLMGDNGFQFGEHGLTDKRTAYEASIRVPLIASGPGFDKGKVVEDVVANIDIAPTLLDAAGVDTPDWYDGSSFLPLASGKQPETPRSDSFIYEYFWEYNFPYTPTIFAIRNDTYKYIQYYGVWDTEELYNLEKDPDEKNNLINSKDPDIVNVKIALRAELFEKLKDQQGNNVIPYNQRRSEGVVQRHGPEGIESANFPQHWMSEYDPENKYEGWLPDTPDKDKVVQQMIQGFKRGEQVLQETIEKAKAEQQ